MLLKQFKRTGPAIIFFIVLILLFLWASAFIKLQGQFSWYFDLNPMPLYGALSALIGTNPLPGVIFTVLLVSFMAILMVNLNTTLFFINERTFLPALFYIMLSGLFPQYQLLNPAIFAAVFLMMALKRILESYRIQGIAYNFFDAGMLISIGSLFYANLVWFGLLPIIGIVMLRTWNLREIFLSVIGLITPYLLTLGIYYVSGWELMSFLSVLEYNLFDKQADYVFTRLIIVAVIMTTMIVVASIFYLFMYMNTKKIQARKTFSLLLWVFLLSSVIYVMLSAVSVEIVWIAGIPISYLMTHYFVFVKKKLLSEIIFSIFFLLIILIQMWYL